MNKQDINNKVIDIYSNITKDDVLLESEIINDLSINSMDNLIIMMQLEEEFNIKIDEEEFSNLVNVQNVCDYIFDKANQK